jgi:hypothetical protein
VSIARLILETATMDFERESFIFHKDWYFAIKKRSSELRVEIYDAIMEKVFEGTQKKLSDIASVVMDLISPQIDRDTEKWLDTREKRSLAGKKHKGNQYSKVEQTEQSGTNGTSVPTVEQMEHDGTNGTVSVSDNVSVDNNSVILEENKDTNVSIRKESKRFVKPTIQEIQAHILEKGYTFDAEAFYAFYESNGWKVGKNPMKNWKMACTTWAKNRKNNNNNVNYGRETITDKIRRTVEEANTFSEQLRSRIGEQADVFDGDTDEAW